tara:strand:+ start:616 stop:1107 length:492 start_codon:yes stop_codon:yes gene_type:complete
MDYMNTDLGSDTNSEEPTQPLEVQREEVQREEVQHDENEYTNPIRNISNIQRTFATEPTISTKASDQTPANILSSLSRFQSQNNYAEEDITETPTEFKESYSQQTQTHNTKLDELMSLMSTLLSQASTLHEKIQEEKEKTGPLTVKQKKEEKELLELKLKLFC